MPEPRFRSRTYRRVHKKLPGGITKLHHEKRKPQLAKCAKCKQPLKGIPRERPYKMRNLGISQKKPERVFGGYLCSRCSREKLKDSIRGQASKPE